MSNINNENEIDIRTMLKKIFRYKVFILSFIFLVTFIGTGIILIKGVKNVYENKSLYEVGNYINNEGNIKSLFNIYNLKSTIESKFNILEQKDDKPYVKVIIPRGTTNILDIYVTKNKKIEVEKIAKEINNFLLQKQKEKVNFLKTQKLNISETNLISSNTMDITNDKRILSIVIIFIFSFSTSIILVFFIEFVNSFKEEKKENE